MKICQSCGVAQKDENNVCIECGHLLGSPVDEATEYHIERSRREQIDDLNEDDLDDLSLGKKRIPFIIISAAGLVAAIVLSLLGSKDVIPFSEVQWSLASAVFFGAALLDALFPKLAWKLETIRLSWYVNMDNASPSYFYIFMRKVGIYLCLIIGVACLLGFFGGGHRADPTPDFQSGNSAVIIGYGSDGQIIYPE